MANPVVMKAILQFINIVILAFSYMIIKFGFHSLEYPSVIKDVFSDNLLPKAEDDEIKSALKLYFFGWVIMLLGLGYSLLQMFGIYYVDKENVFKMRAFAWLHLLLLCTNIITFISEGRLGEMMVSVVYTGVVILFSFNLAQRYAERESKSIMTVYYL